MDLTAYPDKVQTLVGDARKLVRQWLPDAKEGEDSAARMFAYSCGPGYKGVICTLLLSKTGVKLGIAGGASLPDPHGLMRGEGKVHRHVPLKTIDDLRQPGVEELIAAANAACCERLGNVRA